MKCLGAPGWVWCSVAAGVYVGSAPGVVADDVVFDEVASSCGILEYTMAEGLCGGAAAADYDDDNDIDLFVPQALGLPDLVYRNLGDGTFEEVGAQLGVASLVILGFSPGGPI